MLKQSFEALKKKRKRWNIEKVLWFNFRDPAGANRESAPTAHPPGC